MAVHPFSGVQEGCKLSDERFSLKDHLFNEDKVRYLSGLLARGVPGFDRTSFESAVMDELVELELKERIALIAGVLDDHLDADFERAVDQIRASLPPPLDPTLTDGDYGDFIIAPFGRYVENHGMGHYETSMGLLQDLTMRFSMEGSVRPFINAEPARTIDLFHEWAEHENYHVRRLVSESTRPRLPWAPRIDIDVTAPMPLLDKLHADHTRYVTRSVSNHLNDIAKIEPDIVFDALRRWDEAGLQNTEELTWMKRHSLRTLLKRGDPGAMELLGYSPNPDVSARFLEITRHVRAGEALEFEVEITGRSEETLMIDYAIDFVKKSGETRPKVFKLKQLVISSGEKTVLTKRHPLRANATTYRLQPGTHSVAIVANGREVARSQFDLSVDR